MSKTKLWRTYAKIVSFFVSAILVLCPLANAVTPNNSITLTVNERSKRQTIDGFGASACWWSQMVDDEETREELAKLLYSEEGLGLNIYRYNVGGGVNPEHDRVSNEWRRTESFYYYNEEKGEYEYDFTRDANAQAFLFEALKYGCVDTVVLFANSPHYSMTISGEASGNYEQGKTNISEDQYQAFVDYFLDITEYFIDSGVPVKYISPLNEPQWDWSGSWVGQEGCHYEFDQVIDLMRLFSKGIDERGLDVKLSCPESGEIGDSTKSYFETLSKDEEIAKNIGSYSYHSYWSDDYLQNKINFGQWLEDNNFDKLNVEMSEWCELPCVNSVDDMAGAARMARIILNDLYYTGANSWSAWVAVNQTGLGEDGKNYSDGLIYADDDFNEYGIAARYYALAQISKFVPEGSVVLETKADVNSYVFNMQGDAENISKLDTNFCSFATPDGKTVVVISNEGEAKTVNFRLSAKTMSVYTTDSEHKVEETYSGKFTKSVKVSQNSITTVVFD